MKVFTKEILSSIKDIGAIAPSSKYLANNILKQVKFKENQTVLEFGCGNGAITKRILDQLPKSSKLISLEINPSFYDYCSQTFKMHSNFEIYNHSAIEFDRLLNKLSIDKIDILISSLPLSILPKEDLDILFNKIPMYLDDDGSFVQYQYSLNKYKYLKSIFETVKLNFTLTNIPPAFIYTCN